MNLFTEKLKEVLFSVFPIFSIVILLNLTFTPLDSILFFRFILGTILIVLGLAIFLIGVDIGISPLGNLLGIALAKTNRLPIVIVAGIILGFFISIAEPGLMVLANQIEMVTAGQISGSLIMIVVSIGLALMLSYGLVRIVYNIPLYKILIVLYCLTFVLALFTSSEFLAISFDASGATTGILAVPFILSLSVGISVLKKNSKSAEKDSFGLVAISSVGAVISVMLLSIFKNTQDFSSSVDYMITESTSIFRPFLNIVPSIFKEGVLAVTPLLLVLLLLHKVSSQSNRRGFIKKFKGIIYTVLGLILFLVGVNAGFMDVGGTIGYTLAAMDNRFVVIIIGFLLGVVTILAEPAVHVLTHQIEEVTSGYVKRPAVLTALAIGVGSAVMLSILRIIIPQIQLWHYLLPGYIISLALTFFVPKLFVGIAFDAGGVATGPMTATFILAFTHGAAEAVDGANILIDGFGMIALVALTPIITLQILGLIFNYKTSKEGVSGNEA